MTNPNWADKTIWTGDNLPIMRGMNSESVDLIYLDPPFNSNANYAAPIGSEAAGAEFKDTWTLNDVDIAWLDLIESKHLHLNKVIHAAMTKSDKAYLIYMAVRLIEMRRLLKPTGAIYLHCDPTMSHYLKLMMDAVFGRSAFQTECTWQRMFAHNDRVFGSITDSILFYGQRAQDDPKNRVRLDSEHIQKYYQYEEERGRWGINELTGPGTSGGESGEVWRGFDPADRGGRHWSPPKTGEYASYIDTNLAPGYLTIKGVHDRLDFLHDHNLIHYSKKKSGFPLLKRFLMPGQGRKPPNLWTDIPHLRAKSKEHTGYPTQKPIALLERIIRASSKEGEIVLDPFCGCATTLVAADRLKRQWVGIDISELAVKLVRERIKRDQGMFPDLVSRTDVPNRNDVGDLPPYNSLAIKNALYGEQGGDCNGCGTHFQKQHLTVDHIIAQSMGGTDHVENLQLLCGHCNSVKGNRGQEYLLAKLAA